MFNKKVTNYLRCRSRYSQIGIRNFVPGLKSGACGAGLGLAICQKIINDHQGEIWAENNPEGGARFVFVVPYEQRVIEQESNHQKLDHSISLISRHEYQQTKFLSESSICPGNSLNSN